MVVVALDSAVVSAWLGSGDDEAAMTNQAAGGDFNARAERFRTNSNPDFTNRFARFGTNGFRARFGGGGFGLPRIVDWQNDAKDYEFWVRADAHGNFSIPDVRPGTYSLHAIADGVLGDLTVSNVTVIAGSNQKIGKVNWKPVRYGRQVWDIGIPNRNGSEFFKGDDYFHWGWYLEYPKLFPNDVNYVIGKSDFRKDWFFEQVPHSQCEDPRQYHRPRGPRDAAPLGASRSSSAKGHPWQGHIASGHLRRWLTEPHRHA